MPSNTRILAIQSHRNQSIITLQCTAVHRFYWNNAKLSSFILLWSGPNGIKYLCERVKMREMWLPRGAAGPATGPGLRVEGRDGHLVITLSHNLTNGVINIISQGAHPWNVVSKVSQFNKLGRNWGHSFRKRTNEWSTYFLWCRKPIIFLLFSVPEPRNITNWQLKLSIESCPRSYWEQDRLHFLFTSGDIGDSPGGDIREASRQSLPHHRHQEETHRYLRRWEKISIRQSRPDKSWLVLVNFVSLSYPYSFFFLPREQS